MIAKKRYDTKNYIPKASEYDKECMGGSRPEGWGCGWGQGVPLENIKTLGFLNNTGPDSLENNKAIMPAFNVGSLSARKRNAI